MSNEAQVIDKDSTSRTNLCRIHVLFDGASTGPIKSSIALMARYSGKRQAEDRHKEKVRLSAEPEFSGKVTP
jgi:hypothetical protein